MADAPNRRREMRERVLGLLYEAQQKALSVKEIVSELPVEPDEFELELAYGTEASAATSDELITQFAKGWSLERMPILDLLVLRLACYELVRKQESDLSTAVIISEAVELAKTYSTDDSGKFVNGVLSAVADEVRPV